MGLAQEQRAQACLYTDARLRERFFADPRSEGEALGLTREEAERLGRLSEREVRFFASCLQRKRMGEVRKLLPRSQRALGSGFAELFRRYAAGPVPEGVHRHQRDAVGFCSFVGRVAREEGFEPRRVLDLLRYEAAWVEAASPGPRLVLRGFRYRIRDLLDPIASGPHPRPGAGLGLWLRLSRQGKLRYFGFSLPALLRPARAAASSPASGPHAPSGTKLAQ